MTVLVLLITSLPFDPPRSKARDPRRKADVTQIEELLKEYKSKNNNYPSSLNQLPAISTDFTDPQTRDPYEYSLVEDGKEYRLCIYYENDALKCYSSVLLLKEN